MPLPVSSRQVRIHRRYAHRLNFDTNGLGNIGIWLRVTQTSPGKLTFKDGRKVKFHSFVSSGVLYCALGSFQEGVRYYYDKAIHSGARHGLWRPTCHSHSIAAVSGLM